LLEGRSGVELITRFDASTFPVRIAGLVPGTGPVFEKAESCILHSQYALEAAEDAIEMSGLDLDKVNNAMFGVVIGAGDSQTPHGPAALAQVFNACRVSGTDTLDIHNLEKASLTHCPASLVYEGDTMMPAAHLARHFRAYGTNRTCLTACAAGSQAVGEAFKAIQQGDADVILAGGAQSLVTVEGLVGFTLLNALSSRNDSPEEASRPFDAERDGFILSEGAGILVLESLEHAIERDANILAEVLGYGASADAYRVTDPHPDGNGAILCMEKALADASLNGPEIVYVNAHGTSTKANDQSESIAINHVFKGYRPAVTSTKSMIGHLVAAAGAVEIGTCVLSIRDRVIPANINYTTPDSMCDVDVVANESRPMKELGPIISNSFGFGGQNVSIIVGPYKG
jgi:3-oxoacyl-[acyl-carrier-protein] synthase II